MRDSASDFIRPVPDPEEGEKRRRPRRWLIFAGIVLLVLALLLWYLMSQTTLLDGFLRSLRYMGKNGENYGSVSFESYGVTGYALAGDGLAIASRSGVTLFSENGETLGKQQAELSSPALEGTQDALLMYDIGGSFYGVMNLNGKLLCSGTAKGQIFDADIAENGSIALLSSSEEARAVAEVFDAKGSLLYRRTSKTSYLNACALSPDGSYLAVAALGQEQIAFSSSVKLYRTDSEEEGAELSLGGQTIYDLRFLNGTTACAIGSRSVSFFNTGGELLGQYSLDGCDLTGYAFGGDGYVALALDRYQTGSRYQLVLLAADGSVLASRSVEEAPLHLSAAGDYVALLSAGKFSVYNLKLELQSSGDSNGALRAFVRRDGTAILAGTGEARLYIP